MNCIKLQNDQPVVVFNVTVFNCCILYDICEMEFFCNTKDITLIINQSFVVYEFKFPCCGENYVRKPKER